MSNPKDNTLRLVFPQWQGGVNPPYYFGAQMLNWLAPETDGPVEYVDVEAPTEANSDLKIEDGIVARNVVMKQQRDARAKIEKHNPDRIVVIGGDCLVELTPFTYLNEKYDGELAILWVDAHPDIMTPAQFEHAHAMVLGNLVGQGDAQLLENVKCPVKTDNVCYLGVNEPTEWEHQRMQELGLKNISPEEYLAKGNQAVVDWFTSTGAKHLAVHIDLDVLDPASFRALLFNKLDGPEDEFEGIAQGKMTIPQLIDAVGAVSKVADVVAMGITEHLPWDAMALKDMLANLPVIGQVK